MVSIGVFRSKKRMSSFDEVGRPVTRLLHWEDAYMREFEAEVVSTKANTVTLNRTCFFASSGGQPSDTGQIDTLRVVDVRKDSAEIIHTLGREPSFRKSEVLHGSIDWERRYRIMRLHSACHVVSGVLLKEFNVRKHTGIQIRDAKARMDFDMDMLDQNRAVTIHREANRIVDEGHAIVARIVSWDEVNRDVELKTVSEGRYERIDVPRILEIVGFDKQLDGGTHVRNTLEIGRIKIVNRENKGKNNKRITLVVE
jgi:misacylated tRNA(Ala) deacylase